MTRRTSWIGIASLLALAVLTDSQAARAQAAQADTLSADAKKLLADGKTAEACKKFEESQRAEARGATLLDIAQCHEKDGKTATAVSDYKAAAAAAHKEKRYDREKIAKLRILALEPKLPRLTVSVAGGDVAGLDVTVDGASLMKSEWGKPRPLDPGEHTVGATAPGRKAFDGKVTIAGGDRKTVAVPALAEEGKAGAAAAPPAAGGKAAPKPAAHAAAAGAKAAPAEPPPKNEPPAAGRKREQGRVVGEVGAFAALMIGAFETGPLDQVGDTPYTIKVAGGNELIKACSVDACTAHFDTTLGLLVGGEGFLGIAITDTLHLGARGFAAPRLKGGWLFLGGPAGSLNVGPVWVGASFLVGAAKQISNVAEIRGKVPAEFQSLNGGDEVLVPPAAGTPTESSVTSGFALGGNAEVSLPLFEIELGTAMASAWPMFLKGTSGFLIAIPVGIDFRFH